MLTQEQINAFRIAARQRGLNDAQIEQEIERKQLQLSANNTNQPQQTQQPQVQGVQNMQTPTTPTVPQQTGFMSNEFFRNLQIPVPGLGMVRPKDLEGKSLKGYLQNFGRDAKELVQGVAQLPGLVKDVATGEVPIEDVAGNLIKQQTKEYKDLATDTFNSTYERPLTNLLNVLPATQIGKGSKVAKAGDVAGDAKKATFLEKTTQAVSENAASRIAKASPTAYRNALESGVDINKTLVDILPDRVWRTASIDELVGDIKQGGKGGIIKNRIGEAEKVIQKSIKNQKGTFITADELVQPLLEQRSRLASVPGNQSKLATLDDFIDETKKLYPNGLTAEESLNLKRVFDDDFGKAVIDDTRGAATASAQKMLANRARALLKERLPEVKESLDIESELYTIRPILNHAYSIDKTQGSKIRRGALSSVDLSQPATLIDPIVNSAPVRSLLINANKINELIPDLDINGRLISSTAASMVPSEGVNVLQDSNNQGENPVQDQTNNIDTAINNEVSNGQQQNEFNNYPEQSTDSISQRAFEKQSSGLFGNLSKQEVLEAALSSGATLSDLKEVAEMYDLMSPTQTVDDVTKGIANDLRSEYFARTKENGYLDIVNSYGKITGAPNTPAGDVSIIFAYMKMLDPGSVVREGEFATAENTAGIPDQIRNQYNKVLKGKRLGDKQRADFIASADSVFNQYQESQKRINDLYGNLAQQYGIDPKLVGIGTFNPVGTQSTEQ